MFRRLAVVSMLTAALAVSWVGFAGAADDVNSYIPVTGVERLPNAGNFTDHSGVALTPSGAILTVDNDEDTINEYLPGPNGRGWLRGRIFDLGSLSESVDDLEDITWMGDDKYALIDEADNSLSVIRVPSVGTRVSEVYSVDVWPWVDRFGNNGIEGIAYSFDESVPGTDTFYVASESNALLVRLDFDSVTGAFKFRGPDIRLQVRTAAAVFDVNGDDTFYVVSNEARAMYRFDKSGVQLGPPRQLGLITPEGLTMTPDLSRAIVVGEAFGGNEIQEFAAGRTGVRTAFSRIASGANDAYEANGFVTTSGTLEIGANDSAVTGLRFTDICVPRTAIITSAHLALFSAGNTTSPSELTIRGVRGPDSGPFQSGPGTSISNQIGTIQSVTSQASSWGSPFREYVSGLEGVIAEVVSQSDRAECAPINLQVTGRGLRSAFGYEIDPARAPELVIDWSVASAPASLAVSINSGCLAGLGRIDVTVSNPVSYVQEATVWLPGLPGRSLTIGADTSVTTSFTGRRDGRYPVEVTSNGSVVSSRVVTAACEPAITVDNLCLAENGLFRVKIRNLGPIGATYVAVIGNLVRETNIESDKKGTIGVSGRADGEYTISVVRRPDNSPVGEPVFEGTYTVACDPPPPAGEAEVLISCLGSNGLINVILYNSTSETADYTVRFAALPDRVRTLRPGQVSKVTISGRPDGLKTLTILRDDVQVRQLSLVVSCDRIA